MTSPAESSSPSSTRGWVERALSPIAEVRAGEAATALLLTGTMFVLLGAYYMLKTAREALILADGGAEVKAYSSAGQAVLLLALVPMFSALASRVDRMKLIRWVTLAFVVQIGLFILASGSGLRIGIPYFLWVGIFNTMVIAQFWAFANDLYTPDQGKRLFPLLGLGSSLGAFLGSLQAAPLARAFGPLPLMGIAAGLVCVCIVLAYGANRANRATHTAAQAKAAEVPLGKEGAFSLVFGNRYLLLIGILMVLLNVVNTSGEYLFGRLVTEEAVARFGSDAAGHEAREKFVGGVYGNLFSYVNFVGLFLQLFVVSRLFKWLGVEKSLYIHPIVALLGYTFMLRTPSVQTVGLFKIADNAIDYSLGNTTKQALWLPTSREAKYKAKQAVDSFFVRAGDVLQAVIVWAGHAASFGIPAFAAMNVVLTLGWLAVVHFLGGEHHRLVATARQEPARQVTHS
ncbi:NTP/NDP exchange transporter [Luteitalea sp.]|jgi:AAA family ATP:ADP antiporter|uniref:NTP/NDP exchange transporter n=1 Tax=Luteitalea sp. TaxID=2004800 RepID=UPI0037C7F559